MWWLIANYVVIVGAAAWEKNWPRVMYYLGATWISLAVLWMSAPAEVTTWE